MTNDLTLAGLRLLRDYSGMAMLPSEFAYRLIGRGELKHLSPKTKISPQGAGFIGGRLLADLRRAGLIQFNPVWRGGGLTGYMLTSAGHHWLAAGRQPACPHCDLPLDLIGAEYGVLVVTHRGEQRVHPSCVGRVAADTVALIRGLLAS